MQAIIFDLGEVLYRLDEKKLVECFAKKSLTEINAFYYKKIENQIHNYEKGIIETAEFIRKVNNILNKKISKEEFSECWNALLKGFIQENVEFILKLQHKYNIFIMSNINSLHYEHIKKEKLFGKLKTIKMYLSHFEKMRKPEPEFFYKILNENHLIPSKTLFIDDNYQNIKTAMNLGIKTILLENPYLLIKKVKKYLSQK